MDQQTTEFQALGKVFRFSPEFPRALDTAKVTELVSLPPRQQMDRTQLLPSYPLAVPKCLVSGGFCFDLCQTSELPDGLETSFQQRCPEPDNNTKGKLT